MKNDITVDRIANSIRQLRIHPSYRNKSFLIVEGDDDKKVFSNLIDVGNCKIEIAYGRKNVIDIVKNLNKEVSLKGILAIVDLDYWFVDEYVHRDQNLLTTDYPNLEIMLIKSPALEKVIYELLPADKANYIDKIANKIREIAPMLSKNIGCFRIVNERQGLSLNMKELVYDQLIDMKSYTINMGNLVDIVTKPYKNLKMTNKEILTEINDILHKYEEQWCYCQGHDLIKIICIILPSIIKSIAGASVNIKRLYEDQVGRYLRLAYEHRFFAQTELYQRIKQWELANQPYIIVI